MNAQQKSFMLLPDFSFLAGKDIALGRVLPASKETKLPDPRRILSIRVLVPDERVSVQDSRPWSWDSDEALSTSAGVTADISLLTGVGAGVDIKRSGSTGLKIKSDHVRQLTFFPSMEELFGLTADPFLEKLLDRNGRPSVYLITGLLIADGADIETKQGVEHGGDAHVSADLTSVGAPLNTGIHGDVTRSKNSSHKRTIEGQFILAYQLRRLRRKLFSKTVEDREEVKHALFTDEVPMLGAEALLDYEYEVVSAEDLLVASEEVV